LVPFDSDGTAAITIDLSNDNASDKWNFDD
jgi:hypothetical protein